MLEKDRVQAMANDIAAIKQNLDNLRILGQGVNCVEKNIDRMLASLKMLELNINDTVFLLNK